MVNGHIFFLQIECSSTNVPFSLEFQLFISYLVIEIQIFVNMTKILKNGQKWTKIDVFWPIRWFGRLGRSFGRSSSAEIHRSFGRSFGFGRTLEIFFTSKIVQCFILAISKGQYLLLSANLQFCFGKEMYVFGIGTL